MNFTVNRRQQKLYAQHNFDLRKWESLIEDGNSLRREIKAVANEYDVEWDELKEEKDEKVVEALKKERKKKEKTKKSDREEDEDENEPRSDKDEKRSV
jgi:vacuolar-type H+-ATPase subunit I/STV1